MSSSQPQQPTTTPTAPTVPRGGALRSRDFRLYWVGYALSVAGLQMHFVTQGWLIYELTGSRLLLGTAGLAQAVAATALVVLGGVLADKLDQRRVLIGVQLVQMVLVGLLALLGGMEAVEVWHILVVAFALGGTGAFERPAREAMFPHLVQRRALASAVAFNSTVWPISRVLGPAVAGFILAQAVGLTNSPKVAAATIFALAGMGFATYVVLLSRVRLPTVRRARGTTVLQDMAAGLQFIRRNHVIAFLIVTTYVMNFFGWSAYALFPVFAKEVLYTGPSGLGLLYTAAGIGNLLGAAVAAQLGRSPRRGWLLIGGPAAEGAFLILFALSSSFPLSLLLLLLAGIGSSLFQVTSQTTIQLLMPDEFRGRVMAIWGLTFSSVLPLGMMLMGTVAALLTAPSAVVLGGSVVVAFAALVVAPNRRIRRLEPGPTSAPASPI